MASRELAPGSMLGGYRILGLTARGGMGDVYLAEDVHLGRKVAVKVPSANLEADPWFRERFVRESRAAASLDHPNILGVLAAGEDAGHLYLAMPHVEGEDLATAIGRDSAMGIDRVVRIVSQVAEALDAAHDRGLVHRDVKPSNVLLGPGDRAYVSDFGLAKPVDADTVLTASTNLVGTLHYVSPEAIEGRDVDGRADQYALGCVGFEMLTGHPPFRRANEAATLYAHLHDPLPSIASTQPDRAAAIDDALRRATAKDPDERFPSCSAFATALKVASTGAIPSRRRRLWIPGAAAALLAAIAIGVWYLALRPSDDGGEARQASEPPSGSLVRVDPETGAISSIASNLPPFRPSPAYGLATDLASGQGSLWGERGSLIVQIDPETGAYEGDVLNPASGGRSRLAVGHRLVWVLSLDGQLHRLDPATLRFLRPVRVVGHDLGIDLAVDRRAVWVTGVGEVLRVDPVTLEVRGIPVGGSFDLLAAADGWVWAADGVEATVVPVRAGGDPAPRAPIELGAVNIDAIAAGEGRLWVLDSGVGVLVPVSPIAERALGSPIPVGRGPTDVAVGAGAVWVAAQDGNLYRVDPVTLEVTSIPIGAPLVQVVIDEDHDAVWVGVFELTN